MSEKIKSMARHLKLSYISILTNLLRTHTTICRDTLKKHVTVYLLRKCLGRTDMKRRSYIIFKLILFLLKNYL